MSAYPVINNGEDLDAAIATCGEGPKDMGLRLWIIGRAKALNLTWKIPSSWLQSHPVVAVSAPKLTLTREQRKAAAAVIDRVQAGPRGFQGRGGTVETETRAAQAERTGGRVVTSGRTIDWDRVTGKGKRTKPWTAAELAERAKTLPRRRST